MSIHDGISETTLCVTGSDSLAESAERHGYTRGGVPQFQYWRDSQSITWGRDGLIGYVPEWAGEAVADALNRHAAELQVAFERAMRDARYARIETLGREVVEICDRIATRLTKGGR